MIKVGNEPYLECSSWGDRRFSALYARIRKFDNKTIEELYQGKKIFPGGRTGLSIEKCKGKKALNMEECKKFYFELWWTYFEENPELLNVIKRYNGFSDKFGKYGCQCQAKTIYRIKKMYELMKEV